MPSPKSRGYSLIEVLVVVFIVAILALVSIKQNVSRRQPAVLGLASAIEGELIRASLQANQGFRGVTLNTDGTWFGGTPLSLSYGTPPTVFSADSQSDRQHAAIDDAGHNWLAISIGGTPLDTGDATLNSIFSDPSKNLFTGTTSAAVFANGVTKTYSAPFYIAVVGLLDGQPYRGAATVVMVGNGSVVYKFFKAENGTTWRRL